ncbi:MAG: hypothetical protein A2Z16_14590 [Chloroflexi bacterium RBG_16_54_18]|nr:MAG: hypothetical protein A2Z16_14590 [Chloroflexi bacterium RBG_16_54_18]
MSKPALPVRPDYTSFEQHVGQLRSQLSGADPYRLADHAGAGFMRLGESRGEFHLNVWNQPVVLTFPDYQASQAGSQERLPTFNTALLLYYFNTADGSPLGDKWISFTELPDGRFYTQAFQGYSGNELAKTFQNDLEAFKLAAEKLGGRPQPLGDLSFEFQALPRVPVLAACWRGDDEFPSSYKILFDSSASHYLPTDAYAILGSHITHRLISASSKS